MKKLVNIERKAEVIKLEEYGKGKQFTPADEIYFCHVLPGERFNGSIRFDFNKLGQGGLYELIDYLQSRGFKINYDESVRASVAKIEKDRGELFAALKKGNTYKIKPIHSIRIKGLYRPLKPFQVPAVAHMVNVPHVANFSVPGSGKTEIALASFKMLVSQHKIKSLIVIGPRSSFAPWEYEYRSCLGSRGVVVRITGNRYERLRAWRKAENATLVILNYQIASNDQENLKSLLQSSDAMLLLDESHHIKSIADKKWVTAVRSIASLARKRVILTGTPCPNSVIDLWSQISFLYPFESPLGTKDQFVDRIEHEGDKGVGEIRKSLWPLFWRIKKRELSLPRPTINKLVVKLGPIQKSIYDAIAHKILRDVDKAPSEIIKLRAWRRAKIIRLLQAASNPGLLTRYSEEFKLPPLEASGLPVSQLIEKYSDFEVPNKFKKLFTLVNSIVKKREKVIIWTSFVHNIKILLNLLKEASPLPLYGGIPLSEQENIEINREKIIAQFKLDPNSRILIANPSACAESISLHKICKNAIYLDRTFNCAHFIQSKDRIHRIGLNPKDKINYYILQSLGTIDQVVDSRLVIKEKRMLELLELDFSEVNFELGDEVVSEVSEEQLDFSETLKQIAENVRYGH